MMDLEFIVAAAIALLLLVYLTFVMTVPERF